MEIIIGFSFGIIVFVISYREYLQEERKVKLILKSLRKSLNIMDEKNEDRIWNKIDKLEARVTDLEVTLKVSLESLKGKVAKNAAFVTAATIIVVSLIKEFIFK